MEGNDFSKVLSKSWVITALLIVAGCLLIIVLSNRIGSMNNNNAEITEIRIKQAVLEERLHSQTVAFSNMVTIQSNLLINTVDIRKALDSLIAVERFKNNP